MGQCKKDITPLLTHWSYVFLALTHQYVKYTMIPSNVKYTMIPSMVEYKSQHFDDMPV